MMAEFHQIEEWGDNRVVATFKSDTRREGTYVYCDDGVNIGVLQNQPSLHMYPQREQLYMRKVITIIYKLIYPNF